MKQFLVLMLWLSILSSQAQTRIEKAANRTFSKYVGKYETNGLVVQVTFHNGSLVLVVPGAPLQEMLPLEKNKFKSNAYKDAFFLFVENKGRVIKMISQAPRNSIELEKISDTADRVNAGDSLLTLKKSTEHFTFLYTEIDSINVRHIAGRLERSYDKILNDFKIENIPVTMVRIYPDIKSFHQAINFPNAPDYILATAFGKDDFRMTSPNSVSQEDSLTLIQNVTHEFTHCVHLNIDYSPNNPRWLWEGIAMFEADWFFDPQEIDIIKNKQFPPLATLNNGQEYELGYAIIEAIKDIWGFDVVIDLIKKRGDTQVVLQISQNQFEEKIYERIYTKYIQNRNQDR